MPAPYAPVVVNNNPTLRITFGTTVVDLSDSVIKVTPSADPDIVDVGTFANPSANDIGKVSLALTVSLLWSPTLVDLVKPWIGQQGSLDFRYKGTDTRGIKATVKPGALPWGDYEYGSRVECDWVVAVMDSIDYV